jgi:hypothetical protein
MTGLVPFAVQLRSTPAAALPLLLAICVGCSEPRVPLAGAGPVSGTGTGAEVTSRIDWPPRIGESYPDLELRDPTGRTLRLSRLWSELLPRLPEFVEKVPADSHSFS